MHRLALPSALLGMFVIGILIFLGLRPPAPQPADAPPDEFSAARALVVLERLLAERVPHPVGSPAQFVVRDRVVAELEALGYDVHVQRAFSCRAAGGACAWVENIVTRLPGRDRAAPAVMLASHYDSGRAGPGAADAGAAVAAILEVARIMRAEAPYARDVIVLFTDGEEVGLLGAEAFVGEHPWARDVGLVINLEARGTSGPSIMFETSADNRWLVREYARAARRPIASSLTYDVYRTLPNDTDVTVFRRAGMAALNFAFIDELAHYHTALDDLASLSPRSVQHHGENALASVRHFANATYEPRPGDAAYLDVFGLFLLHWPAAWLLPLSLLLTVALAGAIVLLLRTGRMTGAQLGWGTLAALLALAAAGTFGATAGWLIARVTGRPGVLHAWPQPALIALWSGALAAVLLTGAAFVRRAGMRGLFAGPWLLIALACTALAARLPGAAVVLFVPLAVGTTAFAVTAFAAHGRVRIDIAAAAGALGAAFTMIWLARLVYSAFLLQMPAAISAVVGLAALPLLPLLATSPGVGVRERRIVVGGAAAVAATALILALLVPGYSGRRPQPLNLVYVEDEGEAAWLAQGVRLRAAALPPPLLDVAGFTDDEPGWLPRVLSGPTALTRPVGAPAPALELLAATSPDDGARTLRFRVSPAAPGSYMLLFVPGAATARIEGRSVASFRRQGVWALHGVPADGVVAAVEVGHDAAVNVAVWNFAPGLPASAAPLLQARPATAVPFYDGDATVTAARLTVHGMR